MISRLFDSPIAAERERQRMEAMEKYQGKSFFVHEIGPRACPKRLRMSVRRS
jgi:hypothetical protein